MKLAIKGELTQSTARAFVARVEACQDAEINVLVDSSGGDLGAAFVMWGALQRSEARTTAILLRADSAAMFAALGADQRIAARDASAMMHDTTAVIPQAASVSAGDLRDAAEHIERLDRFTDRALALKTGKPDGLWRLLSASSTTLSATDMLRHGLIASISPSSKRELRREHFGAPTDWIQRLEGVVEKAIAAKGAAEIVFSSELLTGLVSSSRTTLRNVRRFYATTSRGASRYGALGGEVEIEAVAGIVDLAQRQLDSAEGALCAHSCER